MRKLFTQLFSILILSMVFVLQGIGNPAVGGIPLTPGSDFSNHKKANTLVLTAPEKVVAGTGVVRLKNAGGAILAAYQATSSNVVITAKTGGTYEIAVNFSSFLQEEQSYTLEVDDNFVKADDDGEPNMAGNWTVLEGDWTAPLLAATGALTPANGGVSVQLNADLTIKFNETVQVAAGGQLFIYKDNGTPHGDLYDVVDASDISGAMTSTLVINTNIDFKELQKYYVTIPDGAIVDYNAAPYTDNKNKFAGWLTSNTWAFTARDVTAPAVTNIMADEIGATSFSVFTKLNKKGKVYVMAVANGQTPVAADFTAGNGMKSVVVAAAETAYKVSLTQFLNVGTGVASMTEGGDYDVWVITENAETVAPTMSAPMKKLDVKTIDVTKPQSVNYYPAPGAMTADVNTKDKMYVVVDEDIKIGTGSVEIYEWSTDLNHILALTVPATSCTVKNTNNVFGDTLFIPVAKTLWKSSTQYFVKYNEGIVTDIAGNKLVGITTTEDWKFTVKDFLAPTYTVVPANGATGVSEVAPQITITFNETLYSNATGTAMVAGDIPGAVTLKKGSAAVTYTVTSFDGKVIKLAIDPASVSSVAAFELSIDTKKFFDLTGNKGTTVDVIKFTLKDYEGPVVTVEPLTPGATDNILVKFNEPVVNANGSVITDANVANMIIFRKGTDASGAIVSAAYSVAADAKSFIINPTNDFTTPGDTYYVRLGAGAVKDAAGNANALKEQIVTVKDFVAPTATFSGIGTSPVNPMAVAPVITFNEAMQTLAGVDVAGDATNLVNLKENGENMTFTATWDVTVPGAPKIAFTGVVFNPSKTYSIAIGKSLQDVSDNLFMGVSTTFTTLSNVAPVMVSTSPANNAVQQANNVLVEVVFDQNITLAAVPGITIKNSSNVDVASIVPTVTGATLKIGHAALVANEEYTVNVPTGAVIGANTSPSAVPVTWKFKTVDTNAPVASFAPTGSGVALNAKLSMTFIEDIQLKSGNVYIKDANNDVTIQTLSEANCVVKADKKTLEITPGVNFDYNKQYYVVVTGGLVEDMAGNKSPAITGTGWNFTTVLNPGPFAVASTVPVDLADKVAAGINPITVTFNRDIKAGSASSLNKIILKADGVVVIDDAANTGRFSYSGNQLTIDTKSDVVANKTYTLEISGGIVTDNYNTPNTAKLITFYTFDNNGPKVTSHTPVKDAANVLTSTNIVVNWDETPLFGGAAISAAIIKSNSLVVIDNGIGNAYTAAVNGLQWTFSMDAPFSQKTTYTVTVHQELVKDAGNKGQVTPYVWSFTTADSKSDAPVLAMNTNTKGDEVVLDVTNNQTDVYAVSEKVNVYYTVVPASATAPTIDEIIALNKKVEFTANGTKQETVTGLTSAVNYKAYAVTVDGSGNKSTRSELSFTTIDVVAPVVTALAPANGAVDVAADTKLKLWFNEIVQIGAGKVVIREVATDIVVGTPFTVTAGNTVVTDAAGKTTAEISTGIVLSSKKQYYVEIDGVAFKDVAGNPMASISGVSNWSFTTKDTVLPLLVKTVPNHAALTTPMIIKGSTLSIEFNEAMKVPASGVVYVRYVSTGNVFEVINANSLTLSADKKTMSFSMVNVPAEQTEFWVDLGSIVLTDVADNAWTNTIGSTWNFIIKDQTPPAIATIVPANNATGVDITDNVVITFTEGIFKAPVAPATAPVALTITTIKDLISLKDPAGASVAYTATLTTVDGNNGVVTVTLNPNADLKSESKYTVTISPVVDFLLNVSSEMTRSFTTKDMTAPKVSAWNPAYDTRYNPKTGVVTVTFSEVVYDEVTLTSELNPTVIEIVAANIPTFFTYERGTVTRGSNNVITGFTPVETIGFTGTISADRKVITLTPVAAKVPLASEKWYRVQLKPGVVEDIADNANAADETIFGIEDIVVPTATLFTPQGPAANKAAMTIRFSEKVQIGTGNIYVRNYANGEVIETIVVNSTNVTLSAGDSLATIKHADFPAAMNFFATADAGTFKDVSTNANPWAGIAIDAINTWKFSTLDAVPPVVLPQVGLFPAPGATNVALNSSIGIIFDKEIKFNTDMVTRWVVIYNEDWTPAEIIVVNSSNIELKPITTPVYQANRIMSIKHSNLQPSKKYFVRVTAGSVVDLAGNTFAGIMDDSWYFTTEDNNPPAVVSLSPADNTTGVDNKTNLVMTFDRSVIANAAGKIKLYKESGPGELGVLIETIDPTSAAVSIDQLTGRVATITLSDWLEYETGYYVIVETGAFTGTSTENWPFAGITTTQGWNFKVEKLVCDPIAVVITTKQQLECSAVVNIAVQTTGDYVLTLDGDTVMAGDHTLASGNYVVVATNVDGDCSDTKNLTVGTKPVVKEETVETYPGEAVHYVNVEAGVDTMLMEGVHTFTYDFESCTRTLTVTVIAEIRMPKIAEIQGEEDESPLEGKRVKVIATVTGVAPGEGFFMQDANAAWSGIWVEFSGATYEGIQIGNGVSVIGEVAEVANVTSLINITMEFVPPMVQIAPIVLAPSDSKAEKYESVLVKVEGARASAKDAGNGEWTIYYQQTDNTVVNDWLYTGAVVVADHYYHVTGIVNSRLDNFKLEPRIESDVKDITITEVPELENAFKVYPNPFNDKITIDNNEKLTSVVISNIAGQRVIDIEYPNREIRTANLVSGIYVISLYTENGIAKTERMIKR
jgi:large repetitive protein